MNQNRFFKILFLIASTLFLFYEAEAQSLFGSEKGNQPKPGTSAPILKHSFAVEKGSYGYIWKIYLEAEDPDGDMLRIASVVTQVGYGYYPTNWTYLKSPYQKYFKGYLQWNTFSYRTSYLREWTQIALRVSVIDKEGNESNEIVFPFEFVSGVKDQYRYQLPAPFDQGNIPRLGFLNIDLFEPTMMGDGSGARDN